MNRMFKKTNINKIILKSFKYYKSFLNKLTNDHQLTKTNIINLFFRDAKI